MKDLISRQDAFDAICRGDKFGVDERNRVVRWYDGLEPYVRLRDVVFAIENLPSAESEIIRCKDCRHWLPRNGYCEVWEQYISNDAFYCGCGDRSTNETD